MNQKLHRLIAFPLCLGRLDWFTARLPPDLPASANMVFRLLLGRLLAERAATSCSYYVFTTFFAERTYGTQGGQPCIWICQHTFLLVIASLYFPRESDQKLYCLVDCYVYFGVRTLDNTTAAPMWKLCSLGPVRHIFKATAICFCCLQKLEEWHWYSHCNQPCFNNSLKFTKCFSD